MENNEEVIEPAPVIEKVSLKEINEEKELESFDEINDFAEKFLALSDEEKKAFINDLFNGND